jgi:hypothetical protein
VAVIADAILVLHTYVILGTRIDYKAFKTDQPSTFTAQIDERLKEQLQGSRLWAEAAGSTDTSGTFDVHRSFLPVLQYSL